MRRKQGEHFPPRLSTSSSSPTSQESNLDVFGQDNQLLLGCLEQRGEEKKSSQTKLPRTKTSTCQRSPQTSCSSPVAFFSPCFLTPFFPSLQQKEGNSAAGDENRITRGPENANRAFHVCAPCEPHRRRCGRARRAGGTPTRACGLLQGAHAHPSLECQFVFRGL